MSGWLERGKTWWDECPSWQRILAVGGIICLLLAVAGWQLLSAGQYREMTPVFTDIDLQDSAAIKEYMDEHNISYEIVDGGTVAVPANQVHEVRLELASEGLPSGGSVGFEIMDELSLGATDFERHVSYIRALQGELARTIEGLQEVEQARVHIVLPEDSVFASESSPASASVFLKISPLSQMDPESIRSVMYLVSAGVEGLEPDNVTVVDTDGNMLSARVSAEEGHRSSPEDNLHKQVVFEQDLSHQLKSTLEQVLGHGNVVVQVSADINFDERQITQEVFEPISDEEGLVTELHRVEEFFEGSSEDMELEAGTEGNTPTTYPYTGMGGESTYERTEVTEKAVVNRIIEERTVAPGSVEELSVAVMVNEELTPEEEATLGDVVSAALGGGGEDEYQIAVLGRPFDTSLADEVSDDMGGDVPVDGSEPGLIPPWVIPYAGGAGLVLVLLMGLLLGRALGGRSEPEVQFESPADLDELAEQLPVTQQQQHQQRAADEQRQALLEAIGYAEEDGLEGSAAEVAEENPARVAELLRTWLAEGNGQNASPPASDRTD